MKDFIKKHLSLALAAVLTVVSISVSLFAFADDKIEINEETFPDINFRNAIAYMYDVDSDGFLSESERNTESMIVSGVVETYAFENDLDEDSLPINNLKGIEYFTNLKSLRCSSIGTIRSLDLSALNKLESLACNDLGLTSIDLSSNKALNTLSICSNDVTSLDFSSNINLQKLHCYSNDNLESINLEGLSKLEELRCDCCSLKSLDLSTNTELSYLNCSYNHLTKLDLSNNTALISDSQGLTEYNLGNQTSKAYVKARDGLIVVEMDLDSDKVVSTSLDTDEAVAFNSGYFFTDDFKNMKDGIDYSYNTGVSDSANMSVHLEIIENEHYYELSNFDFETNFADISCAICKDSYEVSFTQSINSKYGSKKYDGHLDVVKDGIINAKDYAKIIKFFK